MVDIFENLNKLLGFQKCKVIKILFKKLKTNKFKILQRMSSKMQSFQLV